MLNVNENMAKNDKKLISWIKSENMVKDIDKFFNDHLIPNKKKQQNYGFSLNNFEWFIGDRRKTLSDKLKQVLV